MHEVVTKGKSIVVTDGKLLEEGIPTPQIVYKNNLLKVFFIRFKHHVINGKGNRALICASRE